MVESALKTGSRTYSSAIESAENYTRWILSTFEPFIGSAVLEVGLGHGGYRKFLPAGVEYIGLDIDSECVARAQKRNPTHNYILGDITDPDLARKLSGKAIDTVLCINVLEHIKEDESAVENVAKLLRPGGRILIFVPAFAALYSDLDRMAGHVRRYTFADLPRLCGVDGEVVLWRYFNAIGAVGWWINKAFRHSDLDSDAVNSQILLFDRFIVPMARAVDVVARRFFGQSLCCVIQKK